MECCGKLFSAGVVVGLEEFADDECVVKLGVE